MESCPRSNRLEQVMTITLPTQFESALAEQASCQHGVTPEELALDVLRRHLLLAVPPAPVDEAERKLFCYPD